MVVPVRSVTLMFLFITVHLLHPTVNQVGEFVSFVAEAAVLVMLGGGSILMLLTV